MRARVALLAVLVTACAPAAPGPGADAPAASSAPAVDNGPGKGFALAACGGMTDAEVIAAVQDPRLVRDVDSPLGCRWSTGPSARDTSVSLYWYRGSSAKKEAAVARNLGHRVEQTATGGFPGYLVSNTGLCELSAGSGPDFLHWSLQTGAARAEPCPAVTALMGLLIDRVGKR